MRPSDFNLDARRFRAFHAVQERAIRDLSASFAPRDLLIAPTGSGKTLINWCAGKIHGERMLYLVSTKSLEDQVLDSLLSAGMEGIRGHSNYPCATRNTQDDSFECSKSRGCRYRDKVYACRKSSAVTTNYAHRVHMILAGDENRLGEFDVLICDEAHKLVESVCSHVGFTLSDRVLADLGVGVPSDLGDDTARKFIDYLASKLEREKKDKPHLTSILTRVNLFRHDSSRAWAIERRHSRAHELEVVFSPVWPLDLVQSFVFGKIPKVILSSATIREDEMPRLGISKRDLSVTRVPSTFPKERRPVVFYNSPPHVRLSGKSSPTDKKRIINRTDMLTSEFRHLRGLIQCTSYEWVQLYKSISRHPQRYLEHFSSKQLRATLAQFKNSPPGQFLLSPSCKEGEDFPYDACELIIVPKVPFIDVRPALQALRQKSDPGYRLSETARIVEQMCGRGMRRADDFCLTVILDAQWLWFNQQAPFSPHFRDAFHIASDLREWK